MRCSFAGHEHCEKSRSGRPGDLAEKLPENDDPHRERLPKMTVLPGRTPLNDRPEGRKSPQKTEGSIPQYLWVRRPMKFCRHLRAD